MTAFVFFCLNSDTTITTMALSTIVKISSINNLSDARYCAGMGVDMIGFCVDPQHPNYISPQKFKEITGWLSGVKTVAELETLALSNAEATLAEYKFDYIETKNSSDLAQLTKLGKHLIFKADLHQAGDLPINEDLHYYLIESQREWDDESFQIVKELSKKHSIILSITMDRKNMEKLLSKTDIKGIELKGGNEISPGLKDFDELAEILEMLEIE